MIYYIPTTTSNFNNILSTESISPRAYYSVRGFGYSNFQPVSPNNKDNVVLLYDRCPVFEMTKSDEGAYPLVIAIDLDDLDLIKGFSSAVFGSFYMAKTIYLNPIKTKFLFRDEIEMIATINNSERSIETKLTKLYSSTYEVIDSSTESFVWSTEFSNDVLNQVFADDSNINEQIQRDIRIDRLKGMVYGLIIGENRSNDSKYFAELLVLVNKLNNALSTLINTRNSHNAERQSRECESLFSSIDSQLIEYKKPEIEDEIRVHLRTCARSIVEKLGTSYPDEETRRNDEDLVIDELLKQYISDGFYKLIWNRYAERYNYQPFSGRTVLDLQRYIHALKAHINSLFPKRRIEVAQLPLLDGMRISSIPSERELLSKLLNVLLEKSNLPELIARSRYEFGVLGGTIIKSLMGDHWEGEYRTYINGLNKNLNENEPFDIRSTKSPALKAFAALCKKGENGELESFYEYLISNGIGDVKVAFALWGAVYGFASMPKTVTKELFDESENSYVSKIYKHMHKQLFGEDVIGEIGIIELPKMPRSKPKPIPPEPYSGAMGADARQEVGADTSGAGSISPDGASKSGYTYEELMIKTIPELKKIAQDKGLKVAVKSNKEKIVTMILAGNPQQDLFNMREINLASTPMGTSSLCSGELFYCDSSAFKKVKELVREEVQNGKWNLKGQIDFIQNAYKDGYYNKGEERIPCTDKSNQVVIDHLQRNVKYNINHGYTKISDLEIEAVIARLKKLYP